MNKMLSKIRLFLKEKREKIIDSSFKNLHSFEKEWNKFFEKNKYLIYSEKQNFLKLIHKKEQIVKIPWYLYFDRKLKETINENLENLNKYPSKIRNYNKNFVEEQIKIYFDLFNKSPYPLDENQKKAVIKDDKHNLVVAGAGSGKTETLITRIAYLIKRKNNPIEPKRILALAFQNKASLEIKQRLNERYGLDVEIKTFHSLGNKIIEDYSKISKKDKPKLKFNGSNSDTQYNSFIKRLFNEVERKLHNKIIDYLKYFGDEEKEKEEKDFEKKSEFHEYMKNLRYTALDGTKVKSMAERRILNFFITHNINGKRVKIEYEKPAEWMNYKNSKGEIKIPEPDFYFPEYDLYLEHWAIDENNKVPDWFEEGYLESMEIKKNKFKNQDKYFLVETSYGDSKKENFEAILEKRVLNALKKKFPDKKFKFEKLEYKEIVERVWKDGKEALKVLSLNVANFIRVAKTYNLSPKEVRENISSKSWSLKQRAFSEIAIEIYEEYQRKLKDSNEMDFPDMINLAVKGLKSSTKLYLDKFDHILVDEFQDISSQRFELIKELMNKNKKCKLFCVGDDWQSIMGFTGSNLNFFVNFEDYFPNPERTDLTINYRSIKSVVDTGTEIISHNKNQLKKDAKSFNEEEHKVIVFSSNIRNSTPGEMGEYYMQTAKHCIREIKELHDKKGYEWGDIMILRRINPPANWMTLALQREAIEQKVPLSEDIHNPKTVSIMTVHKSKGLQSRIVFILNVDKGLYGFPNELQNPDILEPATKGKKEDKEEEERRLFYVAVTRAKEDVVMYHQKCSKSKFIDEIKKHIETIDL